MITIKQATREDSKTIFNLIKELAIYEEMLDEVVGNEDLLEKNLFENNYAKALLAYEDDKAIGFCLYFFGFSTFTTKGTLYLEDVFVLEDYRKQGIGTLFFKELGKICLDNDLTRMEWVCLDWNQPSIDFYEQKLLAKPLNGWTKFRLDGSELDTLVDRLTK